MITLESNLALRGKHLPKAFQKLKELDYFNVYFRNMLMATPLTSTCSSILIGSLNGYVSKREPLKMTPPWSFPGTVKVRFY